MREPRWCITDHANDAAESWHFGELHTVSVITSLPFISDEHEHRRCYAGELEVAVKQHDSDDEAWVYIGLEGDIARSLILSVESTQRLARTLTRLLDLPSIRPSGSV